MREVTMTVQQQLAPQGILRAAINLSNSLLVSGRDAGGWRGIAVDLARLVSQRLEVSLEVAAYATPSEIAQSAGTGAWNIALIGADPARAQTIAFTPPYAEILAAYLVPPDSKLRHAQEVDQAGRKVMAFRGSAYGLWLERNLQHAQLLHGASFADAFHRFRQGGIDALASLMPKLLDDEKQWPGTRILDGTFMTVRQAIGVATADANALAFLRSFVDEIRRTKRVEHLIQEHQVRGLAAC
jgi:polar amino acid transport system substrate-binding protein